MLCVQFALRKLGVLGSAPLASGDVASAASALQAYVERIVDPALQTASTTSASAGRLTHVISVCSDAAEFAENEVFSKLPRSSDSRMPRVCTVFGMHPLYCKRYFDDSSIESFLISKLRDRRTTAFGEIGLDYHDFGDAANYAPRDLQLRVFQRQLELLVAEGHGQPLVLHTREADDDTLALLSRHLPRDYPIDVHCYSSSRSFADRIAASFSCVVFGLAGNVTFKNNDALRQVVDSLPIDRVSVFLLCGVQLLERFTHILQLWKKN